MALLPPELWIKILDHVARPVGDVGESKDWPSHSAHWQRGSPLKLATVCRDWRKLVHNFPDMWNSLSYAISEHSFARGGPAGVRSWLARSGSRPLTLQFLCFCQDPLILNTFLEVFYPHFPRLVVLRVGLGGAIRGDILPIPRVDMPSCWFVDANFSNETYVAWFAPFFQNQLPGLRALQMREHTFTISHMPVERHIYKLTHLDAAANNFNMRPVDLLRGCPHIVVCRLHFSFGHSNGTSGVTAFKPFTLAHLRTLWINVQYSYSWNDVFADATFPALEEMTLIGSMWPVPTFAPFLERSCCPLRHLSLQGCNASATEVIGILHAVTETLETFYLSGHDFSDPPSFNDALLDALDPQLQDVFVPYLRSLEISTCGSLQTMDGRFLDMVRARMTSTRTVALLHISLSCGLEELNQPSFHKLDFAGLANLGQQYPEMTVELSPDPFA